MCFYVLHEGIERMKTLEELKAAIQTNLLELETLEQNPWLQTKYALGEKAVLREKDIGRLCYEAEETLSAGDLLRLKQALGIDKHQWRLYKARFVHHPPEKD
jgi:hypothetical protein